MDVVTLVHYGSGRSFTFLSSQVHEKAMPIPTRAVEEMMDVVTSSKQGALMWGECKEKEMAAHRVVRMESAWLPH